ncbi:MAG: SIS domain-containing protein [Labilithrix sp.]|nr:SIS domain-containing protein [Labilithrix sp.]
MDDIVLDGDSPRRERDDVVVGQAIAHALRDGARLRYATLRSCGVDIARAARLVVDALRRGNKVLAFGNGGSAADAQHIAAELVGRFVVERAPLPGIALTVDSSALTAIANDYGFEQVFARQVRGLGREGDVAIAITTSGSSPNVLAAVQAARETKMHVIGLTGAKGTAFPAVCDACIVVPSKNTARIQEIHITVGHLICEAVDALLHASAPARANGAAAAESHGGKVVDLDTLVALRDRWRSEGRSVVWTNGVFDVLHAGHLSSLRAARAHGDVLVVGINADEAVRAAKGPSRPVFPAAERAELLAALEVVDHVVIFAEPTPVEALAKLKPDVHCKGADYAPPNGAPMPEAELVRGYGGRIEFLPLVPDRSTTATLARMSSNDGG